MAKKNDGCSNLMIVGIVMFGLGLMAKGCGGDKPSGRPLNYAQPSNYLSPSGSPQQVQPAIPASGGIAHTPESYVPKFITTRLPVEVKRWEGNKAVGLRKLPAGTKLELKRISGYDLLIVHEGHDEVVPADATDLLDQMIEKDGS
ncbi:hypothetical protein [Brevifollis gellanilyticus]|uniref:Uncharacterized protein n=1 Tax=Brevifollis gellanilyticus TaxID=748831 RepID=A0A512M8R6_9BACT|nr:hypothetical protein [Brevifollis gellanilyticus]GEP43093.1 hypothetical protein BGE01nite_23840 [Brevifollis gellanilyticus]